MTDILVTCPTCGTKNRRPPLPPGRIAVCGKCKTPLPERAAGPVEVPDTTFSTEVERSVTPVLLDMWADWCGPCHMLAPTIDQLSSELPGRVKVAKLNIDENQATPAKYSVRGIPTLMLFKNGNLQATRVGALSKSQLTAFLDSNI